MCKLLLMGVFADIIIYLVINCILLDDFGNCLGWVLDMLLCILLNLGMLSGESALHLDCIYIITPDRRKSKMLLIIVEATNDNQKLSFLTFFYLRLSIVLMFLIATYPVLY